MFYFTMKRTTDVREGLQCFDTEETATSAKASLESEFLDAEFGEIFEEVVDYSISFPYPQALVTNSDGSVGYLWSDGVRTAMTVE